MDSPPRYSLKIISLVTEVLKSKNVELNGAILAIRNWNMLMVLVKPSGFSEDQINMAIAFCNSNGFDMVHPLVDHEQNVLSDSTFRSVANNLFRVDLGNQTNEYPFNIKAPTDNSPFFSQFLKLSRIKEYIRWIGAGGLPFLELGYLIVWICLLVCLVLAIIAIVVPVLLSIKRGESAVSLWIYFALLGLGYMLIEISLIQKSILIVGNPITAGALIISSILCFSAIGSYYSSRLNFTKHIFLVLGGIAILVFVFSLMWQFLFASLTGFSTWARVVALVFLVIPLSVSMGMAFPLAMNYISVKNPNQIPIVWGVNGFFSVLAAPIGTILAVEIGFNKVFAISAILYLLCIPAVIFILNSSKKRTV